MNNKTKYLAVASIVAIVMTSAVMAIYLYPKTDSSPQSLGQTDGQDNYALITFNFNDTEGITVKNIGNQTLNNFTFGAALKNFNAYYNTTIEYAYYYAPGGFPLSLAPGQSILTDWVSWYGVHANITGATIAHGRLDYNNQEYNFTYNDQYGWYVQLNS